MTRVTDKDTYVFEELCRDIVQDERYQKMRTFIQHGRVSTYEHCVNVAYTAFILNRTLHIHADEKELITAALLHDYYLYDWHKHVVKWHGYKHPFIAAEKAQHDFGVSLEVKKAIETHMWPLTLFHMPSSRIAWLVTAADKQVSLAETLFHR